MNSVMTLLIMDNADVVFSTMHSVVRLSEASLYMSKVLSKGYGDETGFKISIHTTGYLLRKSSLVLNLFSRSFI